MEIRQSNPQQIRWLCRACGTSSPVRIKGFIPFMDAGQVARFWSRVDQSGGADACWPYTGGRDRDGYGMFKIGKLNYGAHRVAYKLTYGDPDPSHDIDHFKCDNPPCANPVHLEAVTHQQNIARSVSRSTCLNGHARAPGKACRICFNERRRARYAEERGR